MDDYLLYSKAIRKSNGKLSHAAKYLSIPKETFRQRWKKLKSNYDNRPKTVVFIPDSHAKPNQDLSRYRWLGHLCKDVGADYAVDIGDWADMESLCYYDKGKKSFEGRRYKKDIEVAKQARKVFEDGLDGFEIEKFACIGNHEERINKILANEPQLDGIISIDDLGYSEYDWNAKPLGVPHFLDGVAYSHYFVSGVMGRPIGGENHAASLIKKGYMSCSCGHSHLHDFASRTRVDGTRINGLVGGCYFDEREDYAGHQVNDMWWRGVVVKRNVRNGDYDPEFISFEEMKRRYN